ncbi:MAG: D-tyrosyl-tRNA(Tyr) deacylase [Candidatus Cloacimonetes bacterium 4572_55]|nr:MAG: D-tyrosyl-tRNA(Tyr) deacylase [Candidatus Cloacimonetes bacterium 4572_55]
MRIVLQRVSGSSVTVDGEIVGKIDLGLTLLIGIAPDDTEEKLEWMAKKCVNLRVFADEDGKMNRSLLEIKGEILAISQFTLYGDCRKGRRPSYTHAAAPKIAEPMYQRFVELLKKHCVVVESGVFGAMMDVEIHNDGPVTLVLEQ